MPETLSNISSDVPVIYPSELDVIRGIAEHTREIYLSQTHSHIEEHVEGLENEMRAEITSGESNYSNPDRAIALAKQWRREELLCEGAQFAVDRALVRRLRKRRGLDS
jgi:hypothetical protein